MKINLLPVSHFQDSLETTPQSPVCCPNPWHRASSACRAVLLLAFVSISWQPAICAAQQATDDTQDAQVLTRGPVHEAFAGVVTFNPEAGIIVSKAAPEPIEEIPPAERPEGTNVTWIPGYWAWDDERSDFLWISGIWRSLPPGRQWMAGYWAQTDDGYQWTSGYWADASAQETTYLAAPPATVESGPNIAAPSADYGWTPGCWIWREQHYAWRPGYWAQGRADWTWMPAHYVWTRRGYVFVDGFWDYSLARRGVVFAPVHFGAGVSVRPGYSYSPSIAIDLALFSEQLFLRPTYHHYYFGDYYAPSYHQGGFVSAHSYQSNRSGYDPIFAHQRWEHRQDNGWEKSVTETYQYRRDHEDARPPRTWAALQTLQAKPLEGKQNRTVMAAPIDQLAKRKDAGMHFQAVPQEDRQKLALRSHEVQKSRDQRRTQEANGSVPVIGKPGAAVAPTTVKLGQSPIIGKPAAQFKKGEMPPEVPRTPKTDSKILPTAVIPGDPGAPPVKVKPGVTPGDPGAPPVKVKPGVTPGDPGAPPVKVKPGVIPGDPGAPPVKVKPGVTPGDPGAPPVKVKPGVTPGDPGAPPVKVTPGVIPGDPGAPPVKVKPGVIPGDPGAPPVKVKPGVIPGDPGAPPVKVKPGVTPREPGLPPVKVKPESAPRVAPPAAKPEAAPRVAPPAARPEAAPRVAPPAARPEAAPRVAPPAARPEAAPRVAPPAAPPAAPGPQPGKKDPSKDPNKDRGR